MSKSYTKAGLIAYYNHLNEPREPEILTPEQIEFEKELGLDDDPEPDEVVLPDLIYPIPIPQMVLEADDQEVFAFGFMINQHGGGTAPLHKASDGPYTGPLWEGIAMYPINAEDLNRAIADRDARMEGKPWPCHRRDDDECPICDERGICSQALPGPTRMQPRQVIRVSENGEHLTPIGSFGELRVGDRFTLMGTGPDDYWEDGTGIYVALTDAEPTEPEGNWVIQVDTLRMSDVCPPRTPITERETPK